MNDPDDDLAPYDTEGALARLAQLKAARDRMAASVQDAKDQLAGTLIENPRPSPLSEGFIEAVRLYEEQRNGLELAVEALTAEIARQERLAEERVRLAEERRREAERLQRLADLHNIAADLDRVACEMGALWVKFEGALVAGKLLSRRHIYGRLLLHRWATQLCKAIELPRPQGGKSKPLAEMLPSPGQTPVAAAPAADPVPAADPAPADPVSVPDDDQEVE